ncbi:pilin major subunit VirB2 [Sinorhizobium saheli]|uniref:Type IV secretion system protein VirB2 n=1 Tax=Sinorhizobium saheli TaxID=36856 RepID=A0A178Y0A6_SINSA|nr:pilin major subunit VirB2 [Sinorhizobium saheli]MQW86665.1 pilin major subunit VirB2 [Sinorhizobium saheli]OAP40165.1 type IV secretion system protein VirB2 [Sinorhizobium saheli]
MTFLKSCRGRLKRFCALLSVAFNYAPAASGAAAWSFLSSGPAAAQVAGSNPATMVNNICTFILGPFGQSLAVLGIVAIGVSWMFGRASLGLVAGVIGGIVIMFGASFLGQTLIGAG